jgi:hypothetical protein
VAGPTCQTDDGKVAGYQQSRRLTHAEMTELE